jgi:nucleotide-binding universal stress UspA family protein
MKPKKILVGTDFSLASEIAIQRAAALARHYNAQLRVIHVLPPTRLLEGILGRQRQWAREVRSLAGAALDARADRVRASGGLEISTGLITGKASVAIAAAAEELEADLVVIAVRGEGRRNDKHAGLGQTAYKLVGSVETPLLLIRRDDIDRPSNVLAALDLGAGCRKVASWAKALPATGKLTFLHVFEAPFADRLRSYGVPRKSIDVYASGQQMERERALRALLSAANISTRAHKLVLRGDAAVTILAQARKLKIDTLVIGTHTKRREPMSTYANVCRYLASFAPADVLIVP